MLFSILIPALFCFSCSISNQIKSVEVPALSLEDVVRNVKNAYSNIESIEANLEEIYNNMSQPLSQRGRIIAKKPNKIYIEYTTQKYLVISNGEQTWRYDTGDKTVTSQKMKESEVFIIFDNDCLKDCKIIGEEDFEGENTVILELYFINDPYEKQTEFKIWIDKNNWLIRKYSKGLKEEDINNKITKREWIYIYRDIKTNPKVDDNYFSYRNPEEVKDIAKVDEKIIKARKMINDLRYALALYYGFEGVFATSLNELIPKYIKEIPKEPVTGSNKEVTIFDGTGGWYIVNDKNDIDYPDIHLNLNVKDGNGNYYKYY